ncbi:unnamed protein product, partial [Prunus brigantina]
SFIFVFELIYPSKERFVDFFLLHYTISVHKKTLKDYLSEDEVCNIDQLKLKLCKIEAFYTT